MKMIAFSVEPEERPIFERFYAQYNIDLTMIEAGPSLRNADMTQGADCVNVLSGTVITPALWDAYHRNGVRLGVTRCIGMEHMNADYAGSLGIAVRNISYSPASVADYAIMMMLMVLRQVKAISLRYMGQDYTMTGVRGRELPNMTVGIIGAGRIGVTIARHLSGFGCRLLYWNRSPKPEMDSLARYCPLEDLLRESDIVSLHLAAAPETTHFIDSSRLAQMKHGAVLINTARGQLVDSDALIAALESKHLSGAALDVFEGDRHIYYRDHKNQMIVHHNMAILNAMPNVLMMPHAAYFTDQALEDMVHNSLQVAHDFFAQSK